MKTCLDKLQDAFHYDPHQYYGIVVLLSISRSEIRTVQVAGGIDVLSHGGDVASGLGETTTLRGFAVGETLAKGKRKKLHLSLQHV